MKSEYGPALRRLMPVKHGWSNRWGRPLSLLRQIGTALLFVGCLAEIVVGLTILHVMLNVKP